MTAEIEAEYDALEGGVYDSTLWIDRQCRFAPYREASPQITQAPSQSVPGRVPRARHWRG